MIELVIIVIVVVFLKASYAILKLGDITIISHNKTNVHRKIIK